MIPGMNEWRSTNFICPACEWGVYFVYDDANGELFAQRCEAGEWSPEDLAEDDNCFEYAAVWCAQFGIKYCDSLEDAEVIAKKFGAEF